MRLEDSFFDKYSDDFMDFIESHRVKKLLFNSEYKNIKDKISGIKKVYPNVINFLENNQTVTLNEEEQKAIFQILNLQGQLDLLEQKEVFKLGFKEAYIYFKSMNMLKEIHKKST
ncbi:MAG: hypothetical protein KIC56_03930 [Clostridium sp.]|nr:hypothetical protein [Clostridium sp.]